MSIILQSTFWDFVFYSITTDPRWRRMRNRKHLFIFFRCCTKELCNRGRKRRSDLQLNIFVDRFGDIFESEKGKLWVGKEPGAAIDMRRAESCKAAWRAWCARSARRRSGRCLWSREMAWVRRQRRARRWRRPREAAPRSPFDPSPLHPVAPLRPLPLGGLFEGPDARESEDESREQVSRAPFWRANRAAAISAWRVLPRHSGYAPSHPLCNSRFPRQIPETGFGRARSSRLRFPAGPSRRAPALSAPRPRSVWQMRALLSAGDFVGGCPKTISCIVGTRRRGPTRSRRASCATAHDRSNPEDESEDRLQVCWPRVLFMSRSESRPSRWRTKSEIGGKSPTATSDGACRA